MTVEFTLVYRWHSMLPDTLIYGGQNPNVRHAMEQWNDYGKGLGALFEESCSQPAQLSLFNTSDF